MSHVNPVYCALDMPDVDGAKAAAEQIAENVGGLKLGLEFFIASGPAGVREIARASNLPIFLDMKLHDIPNTVAGAVRSILPLEPALVTIHTTGGPAMMEAAAKAAQEAGANRPKIIGVTVLTSLDDADLRSVGIGRDAGDQVEALAKLAQGSGLDGVVCSPHEVARLREICGPDFTLIVPGVRPAGADAGDQKRVMTPRQALDAGADILVIGRPITASGDLKVASAMIRGQAQVW